MNIVAAAEAAVQGASVHNHSSLRNIAHKRTIQWQAVTGLHQRGKPTYTLHATQDLLAVPVNVILNIESLTGILHDWRRE